MSNSGSARTAVASMLLPDSPKLESWSKKDRKLCPRLQINAKDERERNKIEVPRDILRSTH